jgi:hypothetical protein
MEFPGIDLVSNFFVKLKHNSPPVIQTVAIQHENLKQKFTIFIAMHLNEPIPL